MQKDIRKEMDEITLTFIKDICEKLSKSCTEYLEKSRQKQKNTTNNTTVPSVETADRIIPLPQWTKYHDWPSVASLRSMIFAS